MLQKKKRDNNKKNVFNSSVMFQKTRDPCIKHCLEYSLSSYCCSNYISQIFVSCSILYCIINLYRYCSFYSFYYLDHVKAPFSAEYWTLESWSTNGYFLGDQVCSKCISYDKIKWFLKWNGNLDILEKDFWCTHNTL